MKNPHTPMLPLALAGLAIGATCFWLGRQSAPIRAADAEAVRSETVRADVPHDPLVGPRERPSNGPANTILLETTASAPAGLPLPFDAAEALPEAPDALRNARPINDAAITAALRLEDPNARSKAFAQILNGVTAENAPRLLAALEALPPGYHRHHERGQLLYAWGQADGAAAAAYVQENMGSSKGNFPQVMDGWGSADPDAALAFLNGLEDERMVQWLTPSTINGIAMTDPDRGFDLAIALPPGKTRSSAFSHIIPDWIRGGMEVTTRRLQQVPEGDEGLRVLITDRVIHYMGNDYPQETIQLAMQLPDGKKRTHLVGEAVDEWAEINPRAAARWATEVEDPALRREAYREVVNEWASSNPAAAGSWLNDQAPGPERDAAVATFAGRIVRDDPVTALNWASSIQNTKERHETLERVMSHWQKSDPEAARSFIGN